MAGNGTLFSIHTDGKHFNILQQFGASGSNDGANPYGSLLLNGTTLYGTTRNGGNKGNGSVFQINSDGSDYDRIYDFQNGNDAQKPIDNVILLDNTLYGMAEKGGLCGDGAIFAIVAHVSWPAVGLIALGSISGGALGARYGRRLRPAPLRALIVAVGIVAIVRLL